MAAPESSDVNVRGILVTAGALVGVALLLQLAVWWVFVALAAREDARPPAFPPVVNPGRLAEERAHNIPEPRLEGLEKKSPDGSRLLLDEYEWVDEKNGIARIPIDLAMKVIVQQHREK
jgi:hypothetical protein